VEAHPRIHKAFSGLYFITYVVRPPTPRQSVLDRLLVNFHFTVRHGVAVQVFRADADSVGVAIVMNPASYIAPRLPALRDWDIPVKLIRQYTDDVDLATIADVAGGVLGLDPFGLLSGLLLNRDWLTDRYDAPQASSVFDNEVARIAVDDLHGNTPFSIDDGQPFPIYGQLRVEWERHGVAVRPPPAGQ
jgi:hypothetical protein